MLGTHNRMSYLPFKSIWYKLKWWIYRCQEKTIDEQIKDSVRYFDIRVKYNGDWFFAHAGADFKSPKLYKVLNKINKNGGYFRLIFEGSDDDKVIFSNCLYPEIKKKYPDVLDQVVIKEGWIEIKPSRFRFVDRSLVLNYSDNKDNSWKMKLKRKFTSIKQWAKKNNIKPTEEEIDDENVVYFYDFYNLRS